MKELAKEIANILVKKNNKYGNSFYEGLDDIKNLFEKINVEKQLNKMHYLSFYVREKDKLNRLKNLIVSDVDEKDKKDSIYDSVLDIVGYGLLFLNYIKNYEKGDLDE